MHFSKKPFLNFLAAVGFESNQVLLEEGKAGVRDLLLYVRFLILELFSIYILYL
jgi:hypothetical protein